MDMVWAGLLMVLVYILIVGAVYVVSSLLLSALFKRANVAKWAGWVPFYRDWKFFQIGGYPGQLIFISVGAVVLYIIGFVCLTIGGAAAVVGGLFIFLFFAALIANLVFCCLAAHNIGKKLNKEGILTLFYVIFPLIWWALILSTDKSVNWDDSKGRKSLAAEYQKNTR
jgi:hypothetical protein